MIYSYKISVKLQENNWSSNAATQDLYVQANTPDLGVLLRLLDASATVTEIKVCKTFTIPHLENLHYMTREELNIQEKDLIKIS